MTILELQHKQTRLTEVLISALDAREAAADTGSTMLVYLAELFVTRIREELVDVKGAVEARRASSGGA